MKSIFRRIGTLKWIRLGLRRRIVSLLFPIGSSPSSDFEVPYHGYAYQGNISNAQEWHVYFFGGYELKEIALINDILAAMRDPIVMDIGANLGGHSLAMSRNAYEVHSFEPFEPLAARIREQISRNAIRNIQVNQFGLGEGDELKPYFLDQASRNSGTGSFIREHAFAAEVRKLQIKRGDDWAESRAIDFIKIDVEGYEASVLTGLRETLSANEPVILMEVTQTSFHMIQEKGGIGALLPYKYEIYQICNPRSTGIIFQFKEYDLKRVGIIEPDSVSFNVLIVPDSRSKLLV